MGRKLVFVDIDGTLLTERQQVPDSAQDACRAAARRGHLLFLCSGRSKPEIYPWLFHLGFQGLVGGGGSFAELRGATLFAHLLDSAHVRRISSYFDRHRIDYVWQSPDGLNPTSGFVRRFASLHGGDDERATSASSSDWAPYVRLLAGALHSGLPDAASKATFICPTDATIHLADVRHDLAGQADVLRGSLDSLGPDNGDLLIPGVDKGTAIVDVCRALGVDVADTIGIGDSENDLAMLRTAGTGVAMGNGHRNVKEIADLVTDPIDRDGLAHAFERLGLA